MSLNPIFVVVSSSARALEPRNNSEYTVQNSQNFRARPACLMVVWHNKVTRLLHVLGVVEPTQESVVKTRKVSSSMDKRVTSLESV